MVVIPCEARDITCEAKGITCEARGITAPSALPYGPLEADCGADYQP